MPKVELRPQSWGQTVVYHCPGCKGGHAINVRTDGAHPSWGFNGDVDRPTFSPSVLVRGTKFTAKGEADYQQWMAAGCPKPAPESLDHIDTVCHSFVRDGRIEFLGDCTHSLAGQTVDLPECD